MNKKPYLDKVVTQPHVPQPSGQVGYCTMNHFPNLSHTGIRCKFEQQTPYATSTDGRITNSYKANAFKTHSMVQRELIKLNSRETVFKAGHKQFIDKVMCDMEATRRDKYERHNKHWNTSKSKLGFSDSFNQQTSSTHQSHIPSRSGSPPRTEEGAEEEQYYDSNEFSEFPVDADGRGADQAVEGQAQVSFPHNKSHTTKSVSTRQPSNHSVPKHRSSYNTMTLFNSLMAETSPPASPTRRYGTMQGTRDKKRANEHTL